MGFKHIAQPDEEDLYFISAAYPPAKVQDWIYL
jgi:hypothetical protein